MAGRGRSEWLAAPAEYAFLLYLADCAALIARLDVESVDWLGTSMGGLIGMMLAAQPGNPIRRLVLNDVGAFVSKEALAWLGSYVGADPTLIRSRRWSARCAQTARASARSATLSGAR